VNARDERFVPHLTDVVATGGGRLTYMKVLLSAARKDHVVRRRMLPALDALVEAQCLTPERASEVLARSAETGRSVARVLGEIAGADALPPFRIPPGLDAPFVDLVEWDIDQAAIGMVPEPFGRRHGVLPIGFDGDRLIVATADPTNVIAIDDVRTLTGRDVRLVLAEEASIAEAWVRLASFDRAAETMLEAAAEEEEEIHDVDLADEAPIVRAINRIIAQAVQQRASDLHIEPQERDVCIRFRLDGVLHEVMRIPKSLHAGVTSRLKVMADLNIAEKRVPQDGRMTVNVDNKPIDLRMSTVPSVWGEEVILRILDRAASLISLEDLGFLGDTLRRYESAFRKPYGAVLVVGPTGSGKSTTLYSTLSVVSDVSKKIITVEDPVEFRLPGLSQIHVNPKAGLTFATALRSILRSDPDVIMVGEIRDTETARIAVEAAMTGHLVFTTLHTNDAPQAMTRLVEMGVEPFLVASAIECVLAQRLARKLCTRCCEGYTPSRELAEECGVPPAEDATFYKPVGCNYCAGTGYRGRIALVELMTVSEDIERLTVERKSSDDIRNVALEQGMRSLREDGMIKVRMGITSLEEVLRIVEGRTDESQPAAEPVDDSVIPMAGRRRLSS
jgi:type IV pilus assembly protein PilB